MDEESFDERAKLILVVSNNNDEVTGSFVTV